MSSALARLRDEAAAIGAAGVAAVSPHVLVPAAVSSLLAPAGSAAPALHVIAVGKAAAAMFQAFAAASPWPIVSSLTVAPRRPAGWSDAHPIVVGGHPIADAGSVEGGRRALALAAAVPADGCLVCLLSGGASALMAAPMPGLSLAAKQRAVAQVMKAGGDITALNALRKHLSAVKGGRLAAACAGTVVTLAISDVIGDDLSVIGSGPCVPDGSTWADVHAILQRFSGAAPHDPEVVAVVEAGRAGTLAETPKAGDPRLARATARVIGGRREAMAGAAAEAARRGFTPLVLDAPIAGEAREAALAWWARVRAEVERATVPVAVISSGETTVTVRGPGRGGRNQEFALALVEPFASCSRAACLASLGTDGIDGPTDAAGALIDPVSARRAAALGLAAPHDYLERSDSYAYFAALGDLLQPGPSDTNVGDIQVLVAAAG